MKRLILALALAIALTPFAGIFSGGADTVSAHPLGNFTVNRYARILLSDGSVNLRYVVDMAEIPAFQELRALDKDSDGVYDPAETATYLDGIAPTLAKGLELTTGSAPVALQIVDKSVSFPEGQGGLSTVRIVLDLAAPLAQGWQDGAEAQFRDRNYADRLGWREVIVQGGAGVALTQSSAPVTGQTAELTAYPEDQLKSPPMVSEARFRFEAGVSIAAPAPITVASASSTKLPDRTLDGFASLISAKRLTPAFVALSLLAAMAWGAAHALGPGHGKTLVAAYLVGSRGTAKHALVLGLTVTATHTSSVFVLGFVTLYASRFFSAEDLYLWLSVLSGVMVVVLGAYLFTSRLRIALRPRASAADHSHGHDHSHDDGHGHSEAHAHSHATHSHGHDHDHGHGHASAGLAHSHGGSTHSHLPQAPGWRGLIALGISGGLLPCPTALVVMLGAIALDRVGYGLVLVLAFGIGLAGVLTGIGLVLVYARRLITGSGRFGGVLGSRMAGRLFLAAPVLSSVVIFAVGLMLTGRALSDIW